MTDKPTLAPSHAVRAWRLPFSVWFPLLVFALTRLVDAAYFMAASGRQLSLAPGEYSGYFAHSAYPADPGYLAVTTNWDGQWYEFIATEGYQQPGFASVDAAHQAWAWAFPPAYPMLVRLFMAPTGLSFPVASTVLNLLLGAVAMLLLFRLLDTAGGRFVAASGVALWSCFVSAPLFQAAYSESLGACLLLASFLTLRSRKYWLAALIVFALSLTRIITPPLVAVVAVHAFSRWRSDDRPTRSEWAGLGAVGVISVTGAFHWSWIASLLSGPDIAFARTQMLSDHRLEWFTKSYAAVGWVGPGFTVACVALAVLFSLSERSSAWGLENRAWLAAYVTYLALVTPLTSGILRYLLLAPTLGLALVGGASAHPTRARVTWIALICVLGLALQYWWISRAFVFASAVTLVP